jgi:hypothetical protein
LGNNSLFDFFRDAFRGPEKTIREAEGNIRNEQEGIRYTIDQYRRGEIDGLTATDRIGLHQDNIAGQAARIERASNRSVQAEELAYEVVSLLSRARVGRLTTASIQGVISENVAADVTRQLVDGAVARAYARVGPGSGAVYGTRVHAALSDEIEALGSSSLRSEVNYLNQVEVRGNLRGSVRLDVIEYDPINGNITRVFDLKTGSATLTPGRISDILGHLPGGGQGVSVIEIR